LYAGEVGFSTSLFFLTNENYTLWIRKEAKARWEKENTIMISLKLMKNTDSDILSALDPKRPKQTQIKEWIRKALKSE